MAYFGACNSRTSISKLLDCTKSNPQTEEIFSERLKGPYRTSVDSPLNILLLPLIGHLLDLLLCYFVSLLNDNMCPIHGKNKQPTLLLPSIFLSHHKWIEFFNFNLQNFLKLKSSENLILQKLKIIAVALIILNKGINIAEVMYMQIKACLLAKRSII